MVIVPAGVKVHLALEYTDKRKGLDGLATLVREHFKKDPFWRLSEIATWSAYPSNSSPLDQSRDRRDRPSRHHGQPHSSVPDRWHPARLKCGQYPWW